MAKQSKKYKAALALVDQKTLYKTSDAVSLVKKTSITKFDSSIDVSFRLNVDPRHADQQIRGTIVLPHGSGRTRKILAITSKINEATEAGADFFGGKDLIEKIQKENWFAYDVIVATPEMMGELGKLGKLLGPKGLMPNPKTGTVATDIAKAINEIKAGKVEYRVDKEGNIHVPIAKVSFTDEKIVDNLNALVDAIAKARPSTVKGIYFKSITVSTTMGPAVKVSLPN